MPTVELTPWSSATNPGFLFFGSPVTVNDFNSIGTVMPGSFGLNGTTDFGEAIQVVGDGKSLEGQGDTGTQVTIGVLLYSFEDDGSIPPLAPITSVQFRIRHTAQGNGAWVNSLFTPSVNFGTYAILTDDGLETGVQSFMELTSPAFNDFNIDPATAFATQYSQTIVMTTNPQTGLAWTRDELFMNGTTQRGLWTIQVVTDGSLGANYIVDQCALIVDFVGGVSEASIDQLPIEMAYDAGILAPFINPETHLITAIGTTLTVDDATGFVPGTVLHYGPCTSVVVSVVGNVITVDPAVCTTLPPGTKVVGDNDFDWHILRVNRGQCECCGHPVVGTVTGDTGTGAPMSTVLNGLINANVQFFDADGAPLANGSVTFYAAGTLTPLPVYTDAAGTVPADNPLDLDDEGRATFFMGPAVYKLDVKDSLGVSLDGYPVDNIAGSVFPGRLSGAVTLSPAINASQNGHQLQATINKAPSGTHALFTEFYLATPTIGVGGAALSEAATLYIQGAPSVGSIVYAMHIAAGIARFDGSLSLKPVVFADLPASPTEGQVAAVTDSNTNTWGATIAGGGANNVLGFFNGTNWTVFAK